MIINISSDIEGVSCITKWESSMPADEKREARLLMTKEVNAAIEGAFNGGADEIVVQQSHKFILEELNNNIKIATGKNVLDASFDAVFIVGQHSRARTPQGVLCHTFADGVREMLLNDEPIGEIGWLAMRAGCFNVPVAFVSGDEAAVNEAKELLGNEIETATVKKGLGQHAAISLSPASARTLIKEKAEIATGKITRLKPYIISAPMSLVIEYHNPLVAERAELYPGIKRLDATTVKLCSKNFAELYNFRLFSALIHAA